MINLKVRFQEDDRFHQANEFHQDDEFCQGKKCLLRWISLISKHSPAQYESSIELFNQADKCNESNQFHQIDLFIKNYG